MESSSSSSCSPIEQVVINFSKCTLYGPERNIPLPIRAGRPQSRATVLVRGLPRNANKEIVRQIFERCGEILRIEMENKFCLVTFSNANYAQSATTFSGYRVKLANDEDERNIGTLLVHYVLRKDQPSVESEVYSEESETCFPSVPYPLNVARKNLKTAVSDVMTRIEKGKFYKKSGKHYSKSEIMLNCISKWLQEEMTSGNKFNEKLLKVEETFDDNIKKLTETLAAFNNLRTLLAWADLSEEQKEKFQFHQRQIKEDLKVSKKLLEEILGQEYAGKWFQDQMCVKDDLSAGETLPSSSSSETRELSEVLESQSVTGIVLKRHPNPVASEGEPLVRKKRLVEHVESSGSKYEESPETLQSRSLPDVEQDTGREHNVGCLYTVTEAELYVICRIALYLKVNLVAMSVAEIENYLRMCLCPSLRVSIEELINRYPLLFENKLVFAHGLRNRVVEAFKCSEHFFSRE